MEAGAGAANLAAVRSEEGPPGHSPGDAATPASMAGAEGEASPSPLRRQWSGLLMPSPPTELKGLGLEELIAGEEVQQQPPRKRPRLLPAALAAALGWCPTPVVSAAPSSHPVPPTGQPSPSQQAQHQEGTPGEQAPGAPPGQRAQQEPPLPQAAASLLGGGLAGAAQAFGVGSPFPNFTALLGLASLPEPQPCMPPLLAAPVRPATDAPATALGSGTQQGVQQRPQQAQQQQQHAEQAQQPQAADSEHTVTTGQPAAAMPGREPPGLATCQPVDMGTGGGLQPQAGPAAGVQPAAEGPPDAAAAGAGLAGDLMAAQLAAAVPVLQWPAWGAVLMQQQQAVAAAAHGLAPAWGLPPAAGQLNVPAPMPGALWGGWLQQAAAATEAAAAAVAGVPPQPAVPVPAAVAGPGPAHRQLPLPPTLPQAAWPGQPAALAAAAALAEKIRAHGQAALSAIQAAKAAEVDLWLAEDRHVEALLQQLGDNTTAGAGGVGPGPAQGPRAGPSAAAAVGTSGQQHVAHKVPSPVAAAGRQLAGLAAEAAGRQLEMARHRYQQELERVQLAVMRTERLKAAYQAWLQSGGEAALGQAQAPAVATIAPAGGGAAGVAGM